jgi:hypothetical protein
VRVRFDLEALMQTLRHALATSFVLTLIFSGSVFAQDRHAVPSNDLAQSVAQHVAKADADRAAIREALTKPEVRAVAEHAGIDIDRAAAAVGTLAPNELAQAAESARDVNDALVGGANITITTTTLIIILLLVILIIVAAK